MRARTVTAQFASSHTRALLALTLHEPPARAPISLRASAPRPATVELAWQVLVVVYYKASVHLISLDTTHQIGFKGFTGFQVNVH